MGWEDPLEEGMAAHSSILAWRIPMDREAWPATVHSKELDTTNKKLDMTEQHTDPASCLAIVIEFHTSNKTTFYLC